jgi:hypothetical protein
MAYTDGGDAWLDESTPFDPSPIRADVVEPVRQMESLVQASALQWTLLRGGQFCGPRHRPGRPHLRPDIRSRRSPH